VGEQQELVVRLAANGDLDAVAQVWRDSAVSMDGAGLVPSREALRFGLMRSSWRAGTFMWQCVATAWWACWH
jgi:hypothetical protein